MKIEIIDPVEGVNQSLFITSIQDVFKGEHKIADYVNIIFMAKDDLRLMKKEYFGMDVFTDVIAFNLNEPGESIEGEIYLSYDQIVENAREFKVNIQDELLRVLIHGCLHLCGYEDDSQSRKDKMTSLENTYLNRNRGDDL